MWRIHDPNSENPLLTNKSAASVPLLTSFLLLP
jgi:hypothetical protein